MESLNLGNGCHKIFYLDLSVCTQVCPSILSFLQQARKSSGEQATSSPHVILTPCTGCSTLRRGFKLHGHSCLNLPQDHYYRLLASFHCSVTSTNRQSSLDEKTDHFTRVQILKTLELLPRYKQKKTFLRENLQRTSCLKSQLAPKLAFKK